MLVRHLSGRQKRLEATNPQLKFTKMGQPTETSPAEAAHYSLKWATDKFRWRAFGALPTIRASPEGPPIGRLRMAVCPCPVEGPGGVATGGARRSGRLIGNCRAQAPRPGNVGVAGRGSDRPTDWRITPWHHLECRKPSSCSIDRKSVV